MNGEYLYPIELNSIEQVEKFTNIAAIIQEDVRLIGYDENGQEWELSAKSILCSILMATELQEDKNASNKRLWCSCSTDIYSKIKPFIVEE